MSFLLDTCAVSELVAKHPDPGVLDWIDATPEEQLFLSVITIGEIQRGIRKLPSSSRRRRIEAWFRGELLPRFGGRILDIGVDTMLTWGSLVARLEKEGRRLPAIASLVAAIALTRDVRVVTRNEKDYEGTGVRVVNPWSPSDSPGTSA